MRVDLETDGQLPEYGRATRFVRRALNTATNSHSFYEPTPAQGMSRMLDYIERTKAIGRRYISDEQRAAAITAIWRCYQSLMTMGDRDASPESPSGDSWGVMVRAAAENNDGNTVTGNAGMSDDASPRPRPAAVEERYGMRDPLRELGGYRINPRRLLLTAREDRQFQLNEQPWIMDNLRQLERRLWGREVRY